MRDAGGAGAEKVQTFVTKETNAQPCAVLLRPEHARYFANGHLFLLKMRERHLKGWVNAF